MVTSLSNVSDVDINTAHKLSSMLLNEFSYLPWSRAIIIVLGGRSKLEFINGTIKTPEVGSLEHEAWLSKDQLVMSWILNSMERNLAEILVTLNLLLIFGMLSVICMETKTMLPESFKFIKTLPKLIKMENLL